ncbi:MAG: hypothetical protein GW941_02805 [Candidatus Pacebacteria bacterium]|nr:hypothetical protein [Candidatus Paceibacterota bacterium]
MKLRVLLLSFVLGFGFFFSSVTNIYAAETNTGIFSRIREVVESLVAQEVAETESKTSIQNTSWLVGESVGSWVLVQVAQDDGVISNVRDSVVMLYENAPASGETYVADLLNNMKIGPAQPAYAQVGGLGFAALEPVLYAWKQFRNIAYLFFIIITLIIGFMIMMRQKVGSQAAVTAQQAIPQIVIALITVTFSYAVAGFLIDMMYVLMFLFVGLFPEQGVEGIISRSLYDISGEMFVGGLSTAQSAVQTFIGEQLDVKVGIGWISGIGFALVIAFAYLFAMIALFFELLKTYIAIIVSIVLSPLLLMLGALPGRSDVFKDWVMGLVANLMAFPVFLLLVILHKLMTTNTAVGGGFLPPFLMGRSSPDAITSLIGLAIMLIAKDLVVQAKKSFNPKGTGIFEQFGPALSGAVSKGWKGGELIPGVGFTDTNKLPVVKHLGSGKSTLANTASTVAALGGAAWGARTPGARATGAKVGAARAAGFASSNLSATLYRKQAKEYEEDQKKKSS